MKKYSQLRAVWPLIYNKLKNPPPGINLGDFPSKLPSMDKIILEDSAQQAGALGYVSTEDSNHNGIIDKIHIVIPNLEKYLQGVTPQQIEGADPQTLYNILAPFVEVISHEMGHQKDYKHEQEQPFPGGESVADTAAREALNKVKIIESKYNRRSNMNKKADILKRLVKLSDDLDRKGSHKLSDEVMKIASNLADDLKKEAQTAPIGSTEREFSVGNRSPEFGGGEAVTLMSIPPTREIVQSQKPIVNKQMEGWSIYSAKSPAHAKVQETWMMARPAGYDESFRSFVKWYNESRPEGKHMSPQQVVDMLIERHYNPYKDQSSSMQASKQAPDSSMLGTSPSSKADDVYAGVDAEELVKNASVNSVFWYDTKKTPFGR